MTASPRGEQNSRREILNLSKGIIFPQWPLYARIDHTARGRFKRVADASRRTDGD